MQHARVQDASQCTTQHPFSLRSVPSTADPVRFYMIIIKFHFVLNGVLGLRPDTLMPLVSNDSRLVPSLNYTHAT